MELVAIALACFLSVRIGLTAARALLNAVFFLMTRAAMRVAPVAAESSRRQFDSGAFGRQILQFRLFAA
jgi:hypothetical protein